MSVSTLKFVFEISCYHSVSLPISLPCHCLSPLYNHTQIMLTDLNKIESESEDVQNAPPSKGNDLRNRCTDCQTTRTPCWRGGPAGPRTLCNACGIRYRKKRRRVLGLDKGEADKQRKRKIAKSSSNQVVVPFELGLRAFGRDIVLQEDWKKKLGEEEQAAILLMALSCGPVYA